MTNAATVKRRPLVWRLLAPFMTLLLLVGLAGGMFLVRDLSSRAKLSLNEDLLRRSLEARSILHDRELYLLESARFASNLQGMPEAISARDPSRVKRLLRSVAALKKDLRFVFALDPTGRVLAQLTRGEPTLKLPISRLATDAYRTAEITAGLIEINGTYRLAIVAPVCANDSIECDPVGVTVVGVPLSSLTAEAARVGVSPQPVASIYDLQGNLVASSGGAPSGVAVPPDDRSIRRIDDGTATLQAPYYVKNEHLGSISISIPTSSAFGPVRAAGFRLSLVVLAALLGVVAVGFAVSRSIVRQIRPLVETNRALAQGDLTARVAVHGDQEIAELAQGLNQMATQLQADVEMLEARVAERTVEVERLLRERTEFFAGLSHELRTPLAAILGDAALIVESDTGSRGEAIAIRRSAQQLLGSVNDILELAKTESGTIDLDMAEVRIADVVKVARATIDTLAKAGEVKFDARIPRDLPRVQADPLRLRDVIVNLVDNAVKYTPAGGRVDVTARASNGSVSILVSDTGVGIPSDVGARIFEPFFRVKGTRAQRGQPSSGLGLAVAKRLVEAQGGELTFAARAAGGTIFTIKLHAAVHRTSQKM